MAVPASPSPGPGVRIDLTPAPDQTVTVVLGGKTYKVTKCEHGKEATFTDAEKRVLQKALQDSFAALPEAVQKKALEARSFSILSTGAIVSEEGNLIEDKEPVAFQATAIKVSKAIGGLFSAFNRENLGARSSTIGVAVGHSTNNGNCLADSIAQGLIKAKVQVQVAGQPADATPENVRAAIAHYVVTQAGELAKDATTVMALLHGAFLSLPPEDQQKVIAAVPPGAQRDQVTKLLSGTHFNPATATHVTAMQALFVAYGNYIKTDKVWLDGNILGIVVPTLFQRSFGIIGIGESQRPLNFTFYRAPANPDSAQAVYVAYSGYNHYAPATLTDPAALRQAFAQHHLQPHAPLHERFLQEAEVYLQHALHPDHVAEKEQALATSKYFLSEELSRIRLSRGGALDGNLGALHRAATQEIAAVTNEATFETACTALATFEAAVEKARAPAAS